MNFLIGEKHNYLLKIRLSLLLLTIVYNFDLIHVINHLIIKYLFITC